METKERNIFERRGLLWGLLFAFWTLVGLFDAGQTYILVNILEKPIPLDLLIARGLTEWYLWAFLSPLIFRLALWFPFTQHRWQANLLLQCGAMALISLCRVAVDVPIQAVLRTEFQPERSSLEWFQIFFTARFLPYLIVCSVILGISHAIVYYRKYRDRELRASQLQAQLAQAQLQVLKMQLHPHFLFNTLHAISALMRRDLETAERMVARLGELLRSSLESVGQQEVPLCQELEFKPYLEIEEARLGPRLSVVMEIDPEVLDAHVPNLFLQPLLENAIRHGICARPEGGRIELRASRSGEQLHLEIADNGPGLPACRPANARQGIGLANTRARLQQLYGSAHRFELQSTPGRGLVVVVALPYCDNSANESSSARTSIRPALSHPVAVGN